MTFLCQAYCWSIGSKCFAGLSKINLAYSSQPFMFSVKSGVCQSVRALSQRLFVFYLYSAMFFPVFIRSSSTSLAVNWGFFTAALIKHLIPLHEIVLFLPIPGRLAMVPYVLNFRKCSSHIVHILLLLAFVRAILSWPHLQLNFSTKCIHESKLKRIKCLFPKA